MKYIISLSTGLILMASLSVASSSIMSPRRYNLINRLEAEHVHVNRIGCKCIMSAPTKQHTDSTLCMCFNRKDGTMNDSSQCRAYTDGVFTFCTDVTSKTNTWQDCVKHYCPSNNNDDNIPMNKINF